jgi:hypothetical protein
MTTSIATLIRTLSAAALMAAAMGLPAVPAHAEQNQGTPEQPQLCASKAADGSWDFHTPGSEVKGTYTRTNASGPYVQENANGATYTCKDGNWHEVKQFVGPLRPIVVRPIGGVLAQLNTEPAGGLPQLVQNHTGGVAPQP